MTLHSSPRVAASRNRSCFNCRIRGKGCSLSVDPWGSAPSACTSCAKFNLTCSGSGLMRPSNMRDDHPDLIRYKTALRQWIQTHANRLPGVPPLPGPPPPPPDPTPPVPAQDTPLPLARPPTLFETVWTSSNTVQNSGQIDQDIAPINLKDVTLGSLYPSARGSFAIVWKGRWKGQFVALKQLKPEDSETDFRRFNREVRVWTKLKHRNILPLLGVYIDPKGANHMVSPWLEHGHINEFIKRNPGADRLKLVLDIICGVHYLHSHNPPNVHGDLRGANVLISDDYDACLVDFGLSSLRDCDTSESESFREAGAARWMAPELFEFPSPSRTCESDMYSFAMLIIEIFTGESPFHEEPNDFKIPTIVPEGRRPSRPQGHAVTVGLVDPIWDIVQECWQANLARDPDHSLGLAVHVRVENREPPVWSSRQVVIFR